jgi:hypothetical protein
MSKPWSDGRNRPDWYDGTSLDRGIEEYCEPMLEAELARLRAENRELKKQLAERTGKSHSRAAAAR